MSNRYWRCRPSPAVYASLSFLDAGPAGGLSNVLETLKGEGGPPPACRAVVCAALHYLDAELLNALMLRRDCCSTSAVKALKVRLNPLCLRVVENSTQVSRDDVATDRVRFMGVLFHLASNGWNLSWFRNAAQLFASLQPYFHRAPELPTEEEHKADSVSCN